MKSPILLWKELAEELGERCRVCTTRDFQTVTRRVEHEGLSFLTISLADFGKDFDEALAYGRVAPTHFSGFTRLGGFPRFLGGFLGLVFERGTGVLLEVPSVDAVYAIRQLTRLCSKVALPCSYEREKAAYEQYIETDRELEETIASLPGEFLAKYRRVSRLLFGRVFSSVDDLHAKGELVPKHGPGATADRLSGNRKYDLQVWHRRLDSGGFHSVDFLLPNSRYWINLERVKFSSPENEVPVRVISVPKTLKTPRIIAIEPTCMQYAQQAVAEALVRELETDKVSKLFVGFTDQTPNQRLARKGSLDGSLASLDLSEASDRVSNLLVEELLHGYTHLKEGVAACRSLRADVPGFGVKHLTKFASMGSALTFPMEAMVFTTIVFIALEEAAGRKFTEKDVMSYSGKVRIYGDDMIVPAEHAQLVMKYLEAFGFKVNTHKSFWVGNFRESCGKEYFKGYDVSIVKLREVPPSSLKDVQEIISWVSFRNQLRGFGYSKVVDSIDAFLLEVLRGYFPRVGENSPVLGRVELDGHFDIHSIDPRTHQPLAKGWKVSAKAPRSEISGEGALLKFFLKRGGLPSADEKHLERSGRPRAVGIKLLKAPVN
jgi:hypothetical protein